MRRQLRRVDIFSLLLLLFLLFALNNGRKPTTTGSNRTIRTVDEEHSRLSRALAEQKEINCSKMLVYLKFHKVGSASVYRTILDTLGVNDASPLPHWWRSIYIEENHFCFGDPEAHSVLQLYRVFGRSGIQENCLTAEALEQCDTEKDLVLSTLLRDPLDKAISQFFFFYDAFNKSCSESTNTSPQFFAAKSAVEKLVTNTRSITPYEMQSFLEYIKHHSFDSGDRSVKMGKKPGDLPANNFAVEYEAVLSQFVHSNGTNPDEPFLSTERSLSAAIRNLNSDFDVVGTTELMSSFWTLLSNVTGMDFPASCTTFIDHSTQQLYMRLFNETSRPPPHQLFTVQVLEVMHKELSHEYKLFREVQRLHEEQLHVTMGISVEESVQRHEMYCASIRQDK